MHGCANSTQRCQTCGYVLLITLMLSKTPWLVTYRSGTIGATDTLHSGFFVEGETLHLMAEGTLLLSEQFLRHCY